MHDEIRYARSDDVRIAYRIVGFGMPLVIISGLGHSMGWMIAQEFVLAYPGAVRKQRLFATDYGPDSSYRARLMNRCVFPLQVLCRGIREGFEQVRVLLLRGRGQQIGFQMCHAIRFFCSGMRII